MSVCANSEKAHANKEVSSTGDDTGDKEGVGSQVKRMEARPDGNLDTEGEAESADVISTSLSTRQRGRWTLWINEMTTGLNTPITEMNSQQRERTFIL